MRMTIFVDNVMDTPVASAIEYVANITGGNDVVSGAAVAEKGTCNLTIPDDTWAIAIIVKPDQHQNDLVRLRKNTVDGSWIRDNPSSRVASTADQIELRLTVGRLRAAPTVYIPDEKLSKLAERPAGVLMTKTPEGFAYHSLFDDEYRPFMRLDHPVLPDEKEVGREARLWSRLRVQAVDGVNPKKLGMFFHLEYGDVRIGPRLFLSIYVPTPAPVKELDFVVFYSPSTAIAGRFPFDDRPFRRDYPYGLTKVSQEYPRHSQSYLFNLHYIVHQLLATGSDAVLVMPVAPYGDWSVFQTRSGLHRLLLEINLFLHRELLTTPQHSLRPASQYKARSGGSVRDLTGLGLGVGASIFAPYPKRPSIGRVAISAYSSGSVALQALLTDKTDSLPKGYENAHFGGKESEFRGNFTEVWDIDCAHAPYHGYPKFEKALQSWYSTGKRFRLYHSQYTGGDRDSLSEPALASLATSGDIRRGMTVRDKTAEYWAAERHSASGDWSVVRFADGYLSSNDPGAFGPVLEARRYPSLHS